MTLTIPLGPCGHCNTPLSLEPTMNEESVPKYSPEKISFLGCGHLLHPDCARQVRQISFSCPAAGCKEVIREIKYPSLKWNPVSPSPDFEAVKKTVTEEKWFHHTKFPIDKAPLAWVSGWKAAVNQLSNDDLLEITNFFLRRVWVVDNQVAIFLMWCDKREAFHKEGGLTGKKVVELLQDVQASIKYLNQEAVDSYVKRWRPITSLGVSDAEWQNQYKKDWAWQPCWMDDMNNQHYDDNGRQLALKYLMGHHFSGFPPRPPQTLTPEPESLSSSATSSEEKKEKRRCIVL